MQPDFSVIIAAYNAEATLAGAIESALGQRGVSVEVIVVNDASPDGTAEIARAFSDPVRLIDLSRNHGPGGARNAGLDEARGRWIAVLDSDDTMEPNRLVRLKARAEREGAQALVDNLFVIDQADAPAETMFSRSDLAKLRRLTLAGFIRANCIFEGKYNFGYMKPVFERSFLVTHGLRYDEKLRIGEDYLFMAAALAQGARCAVEPQPGYVYHVRGGSISRVLELHHLEAMQAADAGFEKAYQLDVEARQALRKRRRSLDDAAFFLTLVQQLKARALLKAARTAIRNPTAMRHLRMPIAVRLRRLLPAAAFADTRPHSRSRQENSVGVGRHGAPAPQRE